MRVGLFNANGLSGKADLILNFQKIEEIDIFIILETWLKSQDSSAILKPFVDLRQKDDLIITGGRRAVGGLLIYIYVRR